MTNFLNTSRYTITMMPYAPKFPHSREFAQVNCKKLERFKHKEEVASVVKH